MNQIETTKKMKTFILKYDYHGNLCKSLQLRIIDLIFRNFGMILSVDAPQVTCNEAMVKYGGGKTYSATKSISQDYLANIKLSFDKLL